MANVRVRDVLAAIFGGSEGLLELRAKSADGRVRTTFVEPGDVDTIAAFVTAHRDDDVWLGVATRRDASSGALANCSQLGALFADVDGHGDASQLAAAEARLAAFPLLPSIVIRSGGGLHVYLLMREPLDVQAEQPMIYSVLRRLTHALGGDPAAAEPARVLRLPGTWNQKYTPRRPVTISSFEPDHRYNLSEFDPILPPDVVTTGHTATTIDLSQPILEGMGRNDAIYRFGRGVKLKGAPDADVAASMHALNATFCKPPMDAAEMDRLVANVLLQPNRIESVPDVELEATPPTPLTLTSIRDLLAEPDDVVDYLVDDRIGCGSVNLFAGKPKSGKSTVARALALDVARGGLFLGAYCLPRPVWYLALEDKRSEVKKHFRQMGATGAEPVRFLFRQPTTDLITQLHALATTEQPGLIIVDTLQRLVRAKDLNDYAEVTTKLSPILTLARDTGAAVLLIHHAGKSERSGLDAVLGSTALAGSVDNVFLLVRTDRYRVLSSVQRIGLDLPETVLALDEHTGHIRAAGSRHEADVAVVQAALVDALSTPLLRSDLLDAVEARRQLKLEALRRAVDAGTIIRSGAGTKTDPHRYTRGSSADSGSVVPSYSREPQSLFCSFPANPAISAADSGSQVPAGTLTSREPQSVSATEVLPAWVTDGDGPPPEPGSSDAAFADRDAEDADVDRV